jgi:hypothetical protein
MSAVLKIPMLAEAQEIVETKRSSPTVEDV